MLSDIRYGLRMLLKRPGFTGLSILTLAIGIGLTTMMFSVIEGLYLKALPFEAPEHLISIDGWNNANSFGIGVSVHDYAYFLERNRHFEDLAAYSTGTINLSQNGNPERVDGAFVSDNLFEVLRVQPHLGRTFLPGESDPGAERVAVISHSIWQRRFAGDPEVLGQTLRVNSEVVPIVGVLPEGVSWPGREEVYTNRTLDPIGESRERWSNRFAVVGRLEDGASLDSATSELTGFAGILEDEFPETNSGIGVRVQTMAERFQEGTPSQTISAMFYATVFVLLIACFNVANLLLARATLRQKEMAIRTALGASRITIIRQMLLESLLLAVGGACVGAGLAYAGLRLIETSLPQNSLPPWMDISLSGWSLPFIAGITVLAGLVAGLLPALRSSRADVNEILKDDTRTGTSRHSGIASKLMVTVQLALTCIVLICTGLTVRTIYAIQNVDLGFNPENILTARIGLFEGDYPDARQDTNLFRDRLVQAMKEQPGVETVTTFTQYPGRGSNFGPTYRYVLAEGASFTSEEDLDVVRMNTIGEDFFETFETQVLRGRNFRPTDVPPDQPWDPEWNYVALVNEQMAESIWPGEDPVGKRFQLHSGSAMDENQLFMTVVGIAPDMNMNGINDDTSPGAGFYLPLRQNPARFFTLAVKTRGDPMALAPTLRSEISRIDPNLPIYWVDSMNGRLEEVVIPQKISRNLFTTFGIAALFMACIGLYGVMSYSVNQRTQEIGIRMALGAGANRVMAMVFADGSRQVITGLIIGFIGAFFATRLLAQILFGVNPRDPLTFSAVGAVLILVAAGSILIPARRASRVDPMLALRKD